MSKQKKQLSYDDMVKQANIINAEERFGSAIREYGKYFGTPLVIQTNPQPDTQPSGSYVWTCPKCGSVYGPHVTECHRCNKPMVATC